MRSLLRAAVRGVMGSRVFAAVRGVWKLDMSDLETTLVVMSAFAVVGFSALGLVGWMVQSSVKTEAESLHGRADHLETKSEEQSDRLAGLSAELHHARADLTAVKGILESVQGEVDMIAHGPPSMRSPHDSKRRPS